MSTLPFLPTSHISALQIYVDTLLQAQANPHAVFHSTFQALQSTIQALLLALSKPPALLAQIANAKRLVERNYNSLSRGSRWPLGLLDDTRHRQDEEKREKARRSQEEVDDLGRELRHSQTVIASELAGWQDLHQKMIRRALLEFARGMLIMETVRLGGLRRALRTLKEDEYQNMCERGIHRGQEILADDGVKLKGNTRENTGTGSGKRVTVPADLVDLEVFSISTNSHVDGGENGDVILAGPSGTSL